MTPLLTSANWPEVRAALDVSLTSGQLPDATIAYDMYSGRAVRQVLAQVADAESRTGNEFKRCVNAAIFYCAAYIAPAIPNLTRKSMGDVDYSLNIDWRERAVKLLAAAAEELAAVLTPGESVYSIPTLFTVATGTRGK